MTSLRRLGFVLRLALLRLRARPLRPLLVAAGIAVGAATLAASVGGSVAVQDRAVERALAQLGPSDRSVQAVWSGVPAQSDVPPAILARAARNALRPITGTDPFGVLLFREARFGGALVNLGAVDGVAPWVKLRTGRLPRPCRPELCETVVVGGAGPLPKLPYLRVVGRGSLTAGAPLTAYFGTRGKPHVPILLAEGVLGLSRIPIADLDLIARTYGWVLPISPGSIHSWEIDGFSDRLSRAGSALAARSPIFSISGPVDTLAAVHATGRVAGRRLLLIGGEAAVLLLGFAVFAATRLRRDSEAAWRRLTWYGARRSQLVALSAAECAVVAALAVVCGWAVGTGVAAALASHLHSPAGGVIAHSVVSGEGVALAVALAVVATVVVLASLRARLVGFGGLTVSVADVAALAALGTVALALARGDANAEALASGGGTGVVLLLLPGLVVLAAAVLFARIVSPALRLVERAGRRAPVAVRLAALSIARHPGTTLFAIVFLMVSVSLALFAAGYRATLVQNEREQAAYAVPADFVLSEDLQRLVTIQQAAPQSAYDRLGTANVVLRSLGNVGGQNGVDFTLIGLSPRALPALDGWRGDFSSAPRAGLARALEPPVRGEMRGIDLPRNAAALEVRVVVRGQPVSLALNVRNPRGDFTLLALGDQQPGRRLLRARLPGVARGGRVVSIRLAYPAVAAFLAGHRESGTTHSVTNAAQGVVELGRLRAGGRSLAGYRAWIGAGGVEAVVSSKGARVAYIVNRAADSFFRPRQPSDDEPVPVLATPKVAAAADSSGTLLLQVEAEPVTAKVVGVIRRFPSVDGDAVVGDRVLLETALNTQTPGTGVANEIWLDAPPSAASRLARPPFDRLALASQRGTLEQLSSDPLARGSLALLTGTAIVALTLTLLALLLTVASEVRDESGELFDLATQGASPAQLRRHLRLRAALLGLLGCAGGIATGVALSALVVSVVTVTAGATAPVPPLALSFDWPLLGLGFAAAVAAGSGLVLVATRSQGRMG